MDNLNLTVLVDRHFDLRRQMNDLNMQLAELQTSKVKNDQLIFRKILRMKGRRARVGNTLLMIETRVVDNPAKITYKYKHIFDSIIQDYEFAKGYIKKIMNTYKTSTKSHKHKVQSLIITEVTQKEGSLETPLNENVDGQPALVHDRL